MNWILIPLCVFIMIITGDFLGNPEKYGDIMRRFDEARYQHLDCDCVESLE